MSRHGIFIEENGTAITAPITGSASIPVVIGAAPVNMLDNPAAAVNTPILANSASEAMAELGYSSHFGASEFTLCQMMYLTANVFAVSPVVYINVLDPAKHKTAVEEASYVVTDKQAMIPIEGMLVEGLVVKSASTTLRLDTDYIAEFDSDGYLVLTMLTGGAGEAAASVTVSGNKVDPSKVTQEDIIGAYNASTGVETGLQLIRQVRPKLGVVPGLIIAPGWSHIPEVGIALAAKAANINGVYKAMALLDLDCTGDGAVKYTDCKTVKEDSGFVSAFAAVYWPMVKIGDLVFHMSAMVAAMTAYQDADNGDVPSLSPSNKMLGATGLCLADGTPVYMDQDQGSTVNTYGVTTAINEGGWRLWGNYTAVYPNSTDAKDMWFPVRRMFNWHGNNFIQTYFQNVDDPMNNVLIESIVDSENIRCGAYAPDKWAGASIEYLAEDNPITDILAGKMTFRQHIAPYTPAQEIVNILDYDISLLQSVLSGGE